MTNLAGKADTAKPNNEMEDTPVETEMAVISDSSKLEETDNLPDFDIADNWKLDFEISKL